MKTTVQRLIWERKLALLERQPISTPKPAATGFSITGNIVLHGGYITWIDEAYNPLLEAALRPPAVKPPRMPVLAGLALAFGLRTADQLRELGLMQ